MTAAIEAIGVIAATDHLVVVSLVVEIAAEIVAVPPAVRAASRPPICCGDLTRTVTG